MIIRSAKSICLLGLLLLMPLFAHAESSTRVEVMLNSSVDESYITRDYLRALFTLRARVWPDGQPVTLYVFADNSPLHAAFCRDTLGTFPYILRSVWDRVLFSGTGVIPYTVHSEEEMVRMVLATPGAVGYRTVSEDAVSQTGSGDKE